MTLRRKLVVGCAEKQIGTIEQKNTGAPKNPWSITEWVWWRVSVFASVQPSNKRVFVLKAKFSRAEKKKSDSGWSTRN